MILKAYSIYDMKALSFGQPFFFHHHGQALRAVQEAAGDMSTLLARHPADFAIYCVGTWNDETGALEASRPENLGVVTSLLPEPLQQLPFSSNPERT